MDKEPNSRFKFLWIDIIFSKEEKKWYRLLIIVLALTATVIIIYKLKEWITPTILMDKFFRLKFSALISLFRKNS
jgi:hypothetical protein